MKISQIIKNNRIISEYTPEQISLLGSNNSSFQELLETASYIRDIGFGKTITYSRKIFIPLTYLCRDVCHYCTFAKTPKKIVAPYMPLDEIVTLAERGRELGCKEALFTLGEKPEYRYNVAKQFLSKKADH